MSESAGILIWVSVRPLIRLLICAGCGFAITKADIFPLVAARGAGQIMLNIALPCLMFSKIVPAFNSDNIKALGPLIFVGFLYEFLGILLAWCIRKTFWVPHRFRHGLLVAGGWGNYGDIPTSVVMSITGAAPFAGTHDQNLAVAYISALILVFFITLFPLGGHRLISMDFVGPDVENDDVRAEVARTRRMIVGGWVRPLSRWLKRRPAVDSSIIEEKGTTDETGEINTSISVNGNRQEMTKRPSAGRHVSFNPESHFEHSTHDYDYENTTIVTVPTDSRIGSPAPTEQATTIINPTPAPSERGAKMESEPVPTAPLPPPTLFRKITNIALKFLSDLSSPASLTIIFSFPIALVPQLKALFVPPTEPMSFHIPNAPDGLPPLAVLLDAASFIGAASVPLGLICLGSALARLEVPKGKWGVEWPLGAVVCLAIGKMILMPVIGVGVVLGLVNAGWIAKEDKVLQFVCIFFSCLPTATTQVMITQVYSGTGDAHHLPPFLIPQYILMFITMTALTAYTLQMLF